MLAFFPIEGFQQIDMNTLLYCSIFIRKALRHLNVSSEFGPFKIVIYKQISRPIKLGEM